MRSWPNFPREDATVRPDDESFTAGAEGSNKSTSVHCHSLNVPLVWPMATFNVMWAKLHIPPEIGICPVDHPEGSAEKPPMHPEKLLQCLSSRPRVQ